MKLDDAAMNVVRAWNDARSEAETEPLGFVAIAELNALMGVMARILCSEDDIPRPRKDVQWLITLQPDRPANVIRGCCDILRGNCSDIQLAAVQTLRLLADGLDK